MKNGIRLSKAVPVQRLSGAAPPLLLLLFFLACGVPPPAPNPAFYHWKSNFGLTAYEQERLERLGAERLYVRYFDVDWEEGPGPIPVGALQEPGPDSFGGEVVPVVFLTNRTFEQLPEEETDTLARKTARKLREMHGARLLQEVQMDCDWTAGTRERYFEFLRKLRNYLPEGLTLSATIRLHQVKFREQTGVPPVDRGMLMYYNMGRVDDTTETNSILRPDIGAQYLLRVGEYPLPLDAALPLFSWGVVFREGRLVHLLHGLERDVLQDSSHFAPTLAGHYRVKRGTWRKGVFLYPGDELRYEGVNPENLQTAARQLGRALPADERHVVFYHLDSAILSHFSHEDLLQIQAVFQAP